MIAFHRTLAMDRACIDLPLPISFKRSYYVVCRFCPGTGKVSEGSTDLACCTCGLAFNDFTRYNVANMYCFIFWHNAARSGARSFITWEFGYQKFGKQENSFYYRPKNWELIMNQWKNCCNNEFWRETRKYNYNLYLGPTLHRLAM